MIEEFVASYDWPDATEITCAATGHDTPTGGRAERLADRSAGGTFCLTYADGVADIDLTWLIAHHEEHGALATRTVTVVRPELPFGVTEIAADGRIGGFHEEPRSEHWINGGFFCFEPGVLDSLDDDCVLEREPLEGLAADGQLRPFRHEGFWACIDTFKDALLLNDLWAKGAAPWKVWEPAVR